MLTQILGRVEFLLFTRPKLHKPLFSRVRSFKILFLGHDKLQRTLVFTRWNFGLLLLNL